MKTNNIKQHPLLSFEFADSHGNVKPLTFQYPIQVIMADTIEDVLPCFQLVQDAVDNGYYAAGFLSYESAPAFDSAYLVKDKSSMPLLWFGIFSEPLHQPLSSNGTYTHTEWNPSVSTDEYDKSILSIKQAIESGDTYQTNYTIRLNAHFQGDDIAYFEKLKRAQASDYCAYINTGEHSILSASPELFFHLEGDNITTRPMKGTTKRGKTLAEDEENANWLYHSEKNRAENLMIVDLLRNDLGMIAEPGTVSVPKLFEIEHYPTVHQMTSTITASVSANTKLVDIFKALFPCGSITGAPKISTMNIIADLETSARNVYCGAVGFITPNKEAIFNVPIRTVLIDHHSGEATYGVGGGITWDSTTEGEYDEILAKARLLEENRPTFQLLESLLLDNGTYFLLEEHLNRLKNSAQYFGFPCDLVDINKTLQEFTRKNKAGKLKVRLLLANDGEIIIEGNPITSPEGVLKVMLADEPLNKNILFLYHKTTNRNVYSSFQIKNSDDVFDVLLWNEDGELTEFTNGNLVLEIDGLLWTPPVISGLLAGTFREKLLKTGEIHEKILTIGDLQKSTKIWFINSVRKWLEVRLDH
ncbi:aminodeoxychorismate synthase component I [Neobacillus vireti]|uniref:Para-aminobenzoate synthase subunit I n=1 Tax=Neobacillus vireti LMG 21834 TaxID=1131730 RepID=A0AB94IPA2_9BACI|nr:aminodeoxychorismate synthase component I [Neobacillus vireti]ETI68935.1 para-aminobenzoate synthase subunit I [Neobacillus vireti LMG 21834]KLT15761.1 aminobenzoate synthetase [Neobacillus vireti]